MYILQKNLHRRYWIGYIRLWIVQGVIRGKRGEIARRGIFAEGWERPWTQPYLPFVFCRCRVQWEVTSSTIVGQGIGLFIANKAPDRSRSDRTSKEVWKEPDSLRRDSRLLLYLFLRFFPSLQRPPPPFGGSYRSQQWIWGNGTHNHIGPHFLRNSIHPGMEVSLGSWEPSQTCI